jgi:hypothetical protein
VIPSIDFILRQYKKTKIIYADHLVFKNIINSGWQKIKKYYIKTDESPAYTAAIILNLIYKEEYINKF